MWRNQLMPKNHLPNPSGVGLSCVGSYGIPLGVVLVGICVGQILASPTPALAQTRNVNDAIWRDSSTNLFGGDSIDINDLFRAANFLSNQHAASRWDSTASIEAAVEQFNQSRRRPLQLSPSSLQPRSTAKP